VIYFSIMLLKGLDVWLYMHYGIKVM
jgi:hypothetical protein